MQLIILTHYLARRLIQTYLHLLNHQSLAWLHPAKKVDNFKSNQKPSFQFPPPNSMDETSTITNKKRPFEGSNSANKKARGGGHCLKHVAEMVLVLAAMGKIRAGRRPTAMEVKLMTEARGKLAGICKEFAPKDVFPRGDMVIEDLGFNRKLGVMSIAQKLQLTKQKMEKSEVFPIHSATYTPPDSSRSFLSNSSAAHASPISNSRTFPYQLPTSEVRPVGSTVITSSRANSVADHKPSHAPSWSTQSQSVSSNNNTGLLNNVTDINHHKQHQMNLDVNTHNEIAKIVQKVLHPHAPGQCTWTPPSRDYMNKPLSCQTCKSMINEVDNVLICDACEKGYHLRCLQCSLNSVFGDECREWHCAKCLAISNGKPLPLKYGRVMRNVNMPKRSASTAGGQPCLDKKVTSSDENFNQQLMSTNGQDADVCSKAVTQNGDKNEEVVEKGIIVETSERCATVRENEGALTSSMRDVEWVGGVIDEIDGKTYYGSCCVSGTTYKLQDYALFSSTGNNPMPNKLQSMWEDNKTNKKWVTVTRCFFPDDLPAGVCRPCAPESNEVYESNHETTLAAGLIHGPCRILPPHKFSEERVAQTHLQTETFDKSKRFFLCKWFYDEKKCLFRVVTYQQAA